MQLRQLANTGTWVNEACIERTDHARLAGHAGNTEYAGYARNTGNPGHTGNTRHTGHTELAGQDIGDTFAKIK